MRLGIVAMLIAVALVASGCAGQHKRASHVMTPRQAATEYLKIVRPLNKAVENENAAGDDSWSEFQYYATGTRGAFLIADTQLGNPKTWPAHVRVDVAEIKAELNEWAEGLQKVANAPASSAWKGISFQPSEAVQARGATAVDALRSWLGLAKSDGNY